MARVNKKNNVCPAVCRMSVAVREMQSDTVFFSDHSKHLSPTQTQLRMQGIISAGNVSRKKNLSMITSFIGQVQAVSSLPTVGI